MTNAGRKWWLRSSAGDLRKAGHSLPCGACDTLLANRGSVGPAPIDFVVAPAGPLFTYALCPPGTYRRTPDTPSNILGPMLFFGKDVMHVRLEQTK